MRLQMTGTAQAKDGVSNPEKLDEGGETVRDAASTISTSGLFQGSPH